jgi:hypothetical protein
MNWEAIGAIGEVVSAVAVLVTLVYLAVQIGQNTQAMKVTALGTLHDLHVVTEKNEAYIASLMKLQSGEALSPVERVVAVERFVTIVRAFERLWVQQEMGAVVYEQFEQQLDLLRWTLSLPQTRTMWAELAPNFSPGFRAIVEAEVLAADAPASRMMNAMQALVPKQG